MEQIIVAKDTRRGLAAVIEHSGPPKSAADRDWVIYIDIEHYYRHVKES